MEPKNKTEQEEEELDVIIRNQNHHSKNATYTWSNVNKINHHIEPKTIFNQIGVKNLIKF